MDQTSSYHQPKPTRTPSSNSNSNISLSPPDSRRNSLIDSDSEKSPKFEDSPSESESDHGVQYTLEDYIKVIQTLWHCNSKHMKPHLNFRTLVDYTLTRSLALTNGQKRSIKISDLSIFPLKQRSPTQAVALVVRSSNDSPFAFSGCLRAKNVDVCPHTAVAIYLFSRLHLPDSYGTVEIPSEVQKRNQQAIKTFNESRLLKGNNKLQTISYTQQHKAAVKALEMAAIENYNQINIGRFSTHEAKLDKPASATINGLPEGILYQLAGFNSIESYKIQRDIVEPPKELLDQIFPFINDDNFDIFDIFTIRIKNVLGMLRRSLVQDMVILRKQYPQNPICHHPIFTSELFNKFAAELEARGGATNQLSPTPSPKLSNHKLYQNMNQEVNTLINLQMKNESRINYLQHQVDFFIRNQAAIYKDLQGFIHHQNDIYNKQAEYLKSNPSGFGNLASTAMKESLSGTLEMISRLNSSQQNFFSIINNANVYDVSVGARPGPSGPSGSSGPTGPGPEFKPEIKRSSEGFPDAVPVPMFVPPPMGQPSHMPPHMQAHMHHAPPAPNMQPHMQPPHMQAPNMQHMPPHMQGPQIPMGMMPMGPMGPIPVPMDQTMMGQNPMGQSPMGPMGPIDDHILRKRKALHRRLSRQAINVYEMWDDFKSLQQELEENEVSVTEWLKLHGSSERQFRHTRQKIIRFIEEEAQRTNCSVELVKDRLHNKMRNRAKPWTLDEVQRMLTSGKRINLE